MKRKPDLPTSNVEKRDWEAVKKQVLEDLKIGTVKVYSGAEKRERVKSKK